jgi:hypothetical protein
LAGFRRLFMPKSKYSLRMAAFLSRDLRSQPVKVTNPRRAACRAARFTLLLQNAKPIAAGLRN